MKGKLRINVTLNGVEPGSILSVLAKYLDKDAKFNFNQDELNAVIIYDYVKPPMEIFKEIASNKDLNAKIEFGKEQEVSSKKEELEHSTETAQQSNDSAIDTKSLKIAEKGDVHELFKDIIHTKSSSVFKNQISELMGFSGGKRKQVFEDMLDAAMNCPIESFKDVEEYWSRRRKKNKKINISYAINKIESFFEEKGYKIDIIVFLKAIRELSNKRAELVVYKRNTTPSRRKNGQKLELPEYALPLEDLNNVPVFKDFLANQLDTNKSKEENIQILLDIFKCDEFTTDIRNAFEIYINIAFKIKVVNNETITENIKALPDNEKPKASKETLNQFITRWFNGKYMFCCGLERFLQLLKRELRHQTLI